MITGMPYHRLIWKLCFLIGIPAMCVSFYLFHEELFPGRGLFVERFDPHPWMDRNEREGPEITRELLLSRHFILQYYLPFVMGTVITLTGIWVKVREPMGRHILFDEMDE